MLLPSDKRFSGHDFIFYGYDALKARIKPSAFFFLRILEVLFNSPADAVINPTLLDDDQRPAFQYEYVTVVAHSAGAVVARRALLDAQKAGASWLPRVRLVLLAPAHQGASLLPLLGNMMASSFSILFAQTALN